MDHGHGGHRLRRAHPARLDPTPRASVDALKLGAVVVLVGLTAWSGPGRQAGPRQARRVRGPGRARRSLIVAGGVAAVVLVDGQALSEERATSRAADHPPRRPRRVLRVGRAARRPGAARPPGGGGRLGAGAAWWRRPRYEARTFGVHSAMPMAEALRRCPHGGRGPPRAWRATPRRRARFFAILRRFTPAGRAAVARRGLPRRDRRAERLLGDGPTIARAIKRGCGASSAWSPRSAWRRQVRWPRSPATWTSPTGCVVVEPDRRARVLHPLPVARLWGVGEVTAGARLPSSGCAPSATWPRYARGAAQAPLGPAWAATWRRWRAAWTRAGGCPRRAGLDRPRGDLRPRRRRRRPERLLAATRPTGWRPGCAAPACAPAWCHQDQVRRLQAHHAPPHPGRRQLRRRRARRRWRATCWPGSRSTTATARAARVRLCGVAAGGLEEREAPRQLCLDEAGARPRRAPGRHSRPDPGPLRAALESEPSRAYQSLPR